MATKTLNASKSLKTPNDGAAEERKKLLRGMRTDVKKWRGSNMADCWWYGYVTAQDDMRKRIKSSASRASERPGGLGRR